MFSLPSPAKEIALRKVVAWVIENEGLEQIAQSLLSRDAVCRGEKPKPITEAECFQEPLLYRVAFKFQEQFQKANGGVA